MALGVQRLEVRGAAEQALILGERTLDLTVLRQHAGAVHHPEAFGGLALGHQEIADAVLGHEARGLLRQRAPQVLAGVHLSLACARGVRRSFRCSPVTGSAPALLSRARAWP